jgi:hypothetical protein
MFLIVKSPVDISSKVGSTGLMKVNLPALLSMPLTKTCAAKNHWVKQKQISRASMRSNLTGETGWSADKPVHLEIAHRLSAISKIEPKFFYALLRENTLLNIDSAARTRFVINLQTELKPLIYDVAL